MKLNGSACFLRWIILLLGAAQRSVHFWPALGLSFCSQVSFFEGLVLQIVLFLF